MPWCSLLTFIVSHERSAAIFILIFLYVMLFDKDANREMKVFSTNDAGKAGYPYRNKKEPLLHITLLKS